MRQGEELATTSPPPTPRRWRPDWSAIGNPPPRFSAKTILWPPARRDGRENCKPRTQRRAGGQRIYTRNKRTVFSRIAVSQRSTDTGPAGARLKSRKNRELISDTAPAWLLNVVIIAPRDEAGRSQNQKT
jgi:hypothetical protein